MDAKTITITSATISPIIRRPGSPLELATAVEVTFETFSATLELCCALEAAIIAAVVIIIVVAAVDITIKSPM